MKENIFMKGIKSIGFLTFLFLTFSATSQDTTALELLAVEISAEKSFSPTKISLGRSQFLSAAGSFDDPSRLLMKYPGFSVSNDQNNAIIYEGMPSHYSTWSLYGAQIASPNHLSNAGTANDKAGRSAGGVNMFSGQVIGELQYHTGANGPAHGIGGVADLSLRSAYQNSYTANLSLIGLEAGIDRYSAVRNSSFVLNYRYSTVGLLGELGVDLGDEIINYQDLIAEYKKKWKGLEIRFTAAGGSSSNDHESFALQSDLEADFKSIQDINFGTENRLFSVNVKGDSYIMTMAYSTRKSDRESNFIFDEIGELILSNSKEDILSLFINRKWDHSKYDFVLSLNANRYDQRIVDLNSRDFNADLDIFERRVFFNEDYFEIRPKVFVDWRLGTKHSLKYGTAFYINTLSKEDRQRDYFLPFIALHSQIKSFNTILSFQNDRQSVAPEILGMQGFDQLSDFDNIDLNSINSWAFKLEINKQNHGVVFFSNFIYDTPLSRIYNQFFPTDNYGIDEIGNLPVGRYWSSNDVATFGFKTYTKLNFKDYTIDANYSVMDSQMDDQAGAKVPLDFNSILNISLDKVFRFSERKSLRITSSFHFRNGFQRLNIDEEESREKLQTVYSGLTGSGNLADYQRLDLRISYVKKGKWKNVISLDIQNVLNRENDAYYYFDPILDDIQLQKQLGLIPILSWRVVF